MREIDEARKEAMELIYGSDEFIVLTPFKGAKTYCKVVSMLALITGYLNMQKQEGYITDEMIDDIHRIAKLNQKEIEKESEDKIKKTIKEVLKSDDDFMKFIKDLIGE